MDKSTAFNSSVVSAYILILSTAYLWGFWGHFNINILNYIGVTDIIKATIIPMIIAITMYFTQVALNVFNSPKINSTENFSLKTKVEKVEIIGRYSYLFLLLAMTVIGVVYNLITGSTMQRYAALAWVLSTVICAGTFKNRALMEFIPFKNKVLCHSLICYLPVVFLTQGVIAGDKIKSGKDTYLIESNSVCSNSNNNKYRFIDALADKAFALSLKDNSVCIFKYEYLRLVKETEVKQPK